MKKNKEEDIYYCFRYKCKNCPNNAKCEKEIDKPKENKNKLVRR